MAEYVRLRAPKEHGQTLQLPPISSGASMVEANRELLSGYPSELKSIRDLARKEAKSLALRYSQSYSENVLPATDASDVIVMSGHQPKLYHPGVWFKNFALDTVARDAKATAINLVVDNDLFDHAHVLRPSIVTHKIFGFASPESISFDVLAKAMPCEMREVVSRETFGSFGAKLLTSPPKTFESPPLINQLWPEVLGASKWLNLPASLAAGRHRLEQKHGLQTLELPVSVLSTSHSFAKFFERVAFDLGRFRRIYNEALREFRIANRIRSNSHPVPELEDNDGYTEVPFWIWTREQANRRRLFVKADAEIVELTDRNGWSVSLADKSFVADFQELNQLESDIFIRPRALTTTMFSRLFASDLFIHGIGGAKYDELGDEIATRFFGVTPPEFMTATATMKLPLKVPGDFESKITQLETRLRDLRYHPELEFSSDERTKRKRELVLNRPTTGSCKAWHDEIEAINESLFAELESKRKELESEMAKAREDLPLLKLLDSREFSFALFPPDLVEQLKAMVA